MSQMAKISVEELKSINAKFYVVNILSKVVKHYKNARQATQTHWC